MKAEAEGPGQWEPMPCRGFLPHPALMHHGLTAVVNIAIGRAIEDRTRCRPAKNLICSPCLERRSGLDGPPCAYGGCRIKSEPATALD